MLRKDKSLYFQSHVRQIVNKLTVANDLSCINKYISLRSEVGLLNIPRGLRNAPQKGAMQEAHGHAGSGPDAPPGTASGVRSRQGRSARPRTSSCFGFRVSGYRMGSGIRAQVPGFECGVREGRVFKAHRLVYHSTLGSRVIKKSKHPRERRTERKVGGVVRHVGERRVGVEGHHQRLGPDVLPVPEFGVGFWVSHFARWTTTTQPF